MKKMLALALSLCLLLSAVPALAAGQLTITQSTYTPAKPSSTLYAYVYAEVTNTGDAPINAVNGVYQVLGADGSVISDNKVYKAYPAILGPGETGFIHEYVSIRDAEGPEAVPGYVLTMDGESTTNNPYTYFPATGVVEEVPYWFSTAYLVTVTITNNTDETLYEPAMSFGLYDANGKLLYADNQPLNGLGIPAGNSLEVLFAVDEFVDIWKANDTIPVTVKALAWLTD